MPDTSAVGAAPSAYDPEALVPRFFDHALPAVDLDTVQARRFDDGRMWTFEAPPVGYFARRYDVRPDSAWLARARLAALRIPGCSASFVSPQGLVLTNHHCARDYVTQVSAPGEALLEEGFYAADLDAERRVDGLYADQLVALQDVTDEVDAALDSAQTDAERAEARRAVFARLAERATAAAGGAGAGYRTEVKALYQGARHSAYTYRRYDDVRLVFAPELQMGYFGGDADNFTYPRYALDMALLRVYDADGAPLESPHFFPWSQSGARQGEPVFVVGNPGSTNRRETVAQLAYRRDVQDLAVLDLLASRLDALRGFLATQSEAPEDLRNAAFSLGNGQKLYQGRLRALRDDYVRARKQAGQTALRDSLRFSPPLVRRYAALVDRLAALQDEKRALAAETRAFTGLTSPLLASAVLRRALAARRYRARQADGAPDDQLADLRARVTGVADQPPDLQRRYLAARLAAVQRHLGAPDSADGDSGAPDSTAAAALGGRAPAAVAADVVAQSVLADSARTAQALAADTLAADDPALRLADALAPRYRRYRRAMAGLTAREAALARRLGQVRYRMQGDRVPPDATFSLRLSDGVVWGYAYNGTLAPPFTTIFGLYGQARAHATAPGDRGAPWSLPLRWRTAPAALDRTTPLNFVATTDITGGNSGSPLLNRDLEVVGLAFDGNIEALAGDFIFLPERMRTVAVDVRGMREALDVVYDADRLARELDGQFVRSEAEADAL
jgi:hypothetical protein